MKMITVTTANIIHRHYIADHAIADAAHKTIVDAMAAHQEYGNKQEVVVTVDTGSGTSSFRISQLLATSCENLDGTVEDHVTLALWKKKVDDAVKTASVVSEEEMAGNGRGLR